MRGSEADVPGDPHVAGSRRTGGRAGGGEGDEHSTTGTTSNDTVVGRVSGEDADDVGETGAEVRARATDADDTDR
jgi:hypothetical protein